MTTTLTYDDSQARVSISVDQLPEPSLDDLITAIVQRSTDGGIHWTTVRGLAEAPIVSGGLSKFDYEFRSHVENQYRVGINQILDTFTRTVVDSWGTCDTGQTWDTTDPGSEADVAGGVGSLVHGTDNTRHYAILSDTDSGNNEDISVTAQVSATDITGSTCSFGVMMRHIDADNHYLARVTVSTAEVMTLELISEFEAETSVIESAVLPFTHVSSNAYRIRLRITGSHTLQAKCWVPANTSEPDWTISVQVPSARRIFSGDVGIRSSRDSGNTNAALTFSFDDFVADIGEPQWLQSNNITPQMTQVWLKSVTRPFLNQPLAVACSSVMGEDAIDLLTSDNVSRSLRSAIVPIINRTYPVGMNELSLGRIMPLRLRSHTRAGHQSLDYLFASGDTLLIHTPGTECALTIESGYILPISVTYNRHRRYRNRVVWESTVEEVAVPGPDIAYAEATWATVLAQFGSWSAVMAACPTWADVLALLPQPSEVIVE